MRVKVICPASCGELVQGIIGDSEKLVSLPIDMYSEVTIEETKEKKGESFNRNRVKSYLALEKTLEYHDVPLDYIKNLSLNIESKIPIAKGMASSTADIAGVIIATSKLLGKRLKAEELSKLCCAIEPTDSIIFERLTLFDHINGRIIESFDYKLNFKVMILELDSIIDTKEFRKNDFDSIRQQNRKNLEKSYNLFREGCLKEDKKLIGKAVTISSMANQNIIYKPLLEDIIEISSKNGAYGVNVAHSGTVVGILYDNTMVDKSKLLEDLKTNGITKNYIKMYSVDTGIGGVKILEG